MGGKYFTEKERYQLDAYYNKLKLKPKEIALLMNKHINTIYNELKRGRIELIDTHLKKYYKYCPDYAQLNYEYNATAKGRQLKISNDFDFVDFIENKVINEHYSLYSSLVLANDKFNTKVCLRTLYNYVYNNVFYHLNVDKLTYNRRKKQNKIKSAKCIYQLGKQYIDERPFSFYEREKFGNWEMDTIVSGKGSKEVLLVLTERSSRYELIYKLQNKSCGEVWKCIENIYNVLGDKFNKLFKTITCDNGCEFSTNYDFNNHNVKEFVQTNLYYCHPYRSSERGSNEKQNSLIRRWVAKGSNISNYTIDCILNVRNWLNSYPRKLFNGCSSNDIVKDIGYYDLLCKI